MPGIVFFDTETTGLPQFAAGAGAPNQPHIMQLGAILQDLDTKRVVKEINLLLRLPDEVEPDPKAVEVHKITKDMCQTYGVKPITALRLFELMLSRAEIVVAHNLKFDALLYEAMVLRHPDHLDMRAFRNCRPSCTMMNSTSICRIPSPHRPGTWKWPTLKEAHQHFFLGTPWNEDGAHDAMYDVRVCQSIYWAIQDRMPQ